MFFWWFVGGCEFAIALRASIEFVFDSIIDLFGLEKLMQILFVSFLCSDFFLSSSVLLFGRFDDVGGGRFGRVARVLFELSDFVEGGFE